jgi:glycosyltransferase involved in cell wall biosynthesis
MNNPVVSVIIPCYNAELFIEETVNSILNQTFSDFEIIIVNDGSTDNSVQKIEKFLNDPRIKLINKDNGGVSSARNVGLKLSRGTYIALFDADDIMLDNNLEEKVKILENNKDVLFVFSDLIAFYQDSKEEIIKGYYTDNITNQYLLQKDLPIPGICSNVLFRSSIINEKNVFFDENLSTSADQDFLIFLSLYGKGYYISKPLWKYRILPNSMSRKVASIASNHLYMLKKYNQLGLYDSRKQEKICISNTYLILAGCYWVNANKKIKGLIYILLSIWYYPKVAKILLNKTIFFGKKFFSIA